MKGIKRMKNVDVCSGPCCPGYVEEAADPPNLSPLIWCEKEAVVQVNKGVSPADGILPHC